MYRTLPYMHIFEWKERERGLGLGLGLSIFSELTMKSAVPRGHDTPRYSEVQALIKGVSKNSI